MAKDVAKGVSIVIIRCQHPPQARTRVLTCGTGHIAVTKPVIENTGYLMKTPPPRSVFTAETASGDVSCGATMAALATTGPPPHQRRLNHSNAPMYILPTPGQTTETIFVSP